MEGRPDRRHPRFPLRAVRDGEPQRRAAVDAVVDRVPSRAQASAATTRAPNSPQNPNVVNETLRAGADIFASAMLCSFLRLSICNDPFARLGLKNMEIKD